MKKNKKLSITIGIPTYKSANNIANLLTNLLGQQTSVNFSLRQIMVYLDAPKDETVNEVKKIAKTAKKIKVFDMKIRKGMAQGFKYMLKSNKSNIFILLNDDILIKDKLFISKLIRPFIAYKNIGLVSGNPQPFGSLNFVSRAGISTFRAFERTRYAIRNGDNKWTCDGKVLALSENFIKSIVFPKNDSDMGNVDAYLYFSCIINNFVYKHARNAVVFFDFPTTVKDYIKWVTRANANRFIMRKSFGKIVDKEYKQPTLIHIGSELKETVKNPLGVIFIFFLGIYAKHKAKSYSTNFSSTWDVIKSTKKSLVGSNR